MQKDCQRTASHLSTSIPSRRILWCAWFALLMGSPYAARQFVWGTTNVGTSSMSRLFPLVAAGMVLGIWIASHPPNLHVTRALGASTADSTSPNPILAKRARRSFVIITALLTVGVLIPTWANYLLSAISQTSILDLDSWKALFGSKEGLDAFRTLLGWPLTASSLLSGLACGMSGWAMFAQGVCIPMGPPDQSSLDAGIPGNPSQHHPCANHYRLFMAVAIFMLGVLQPLAWALLLPRGERVLYRITHMEIPAMPLPALAMFLFAWVATSNDSSDTAAGHASHQRFSSVVALCAGILFFRVCGRIAPSLQSPSDTLTITALVGYVLVGTFALLGALRRPSAPKKSAEPIQAGPPDPSPTRENSSSASANAALISLLERQGMSAREIDVALGFLAGHSVASTAYNLGISRSAIYEYRNRCKDKLGAHSNAEFLNALKALQPVPNTNKDAHPHDGELENTNSSSGANPVSVMASFNSRPSDQRLAKRWRFPERGRASTSWLAWNLGLGCVLACALLVLLPFDGAIRWQSDLWVSCFGIAAGLVLGWLFSEVMLSCFGETSLLGKRSWLTTACSVVAILSSTTAGAVLCAHRLGLIGFSGMVIGGFAPQKALLITATALISASMKTLLEHYIRGQRPSFPWKGLPKSTTRLMEIGMPSAVACALVCIAGGGIRPWAGCFVLSGACGWLLHPNRFSLASTPVPARGRCARTIPMLYALMFLAWTLEEVWRAQYYLSLLPFAQWGAALVLAVLAIGTTRRSPEERYVAGISTLGGMVVCVATQVPFGLVTFAVLLYALRNLRGLAPMGGLAPNPRAPWHTGTLAVAAGLVCGTLFTNFYGHMLSFNTVFLAKVGISNGTWGIYVFAMAASVVLAALAFAAVTVEVRYDNAAAQFHLAPQERERAQAFFVCKGLSTDQARIVTLLAQGQTVNEVARALSYSRSAVGLARHNAYQVLGVSTREGLADVLRSAITLKNDE